MWTFPNIKIMKQRVKQPFNFSPNYLKCNGNIKVVERSTSSDKFL